MTKCGGFRSGKSLAALAGALSLVGCSGGLDGAQVAESGSAKVTASAADASSGPWALRVKANPPDLAVAFDDGWEIEAQTAVTGLSETAARYVEESASLEIRVVREDGREILKDKVTGKKFATWRVPVASLEGLLEAEIKLTAPESAGLPKLPARKLRLVRLAQGKSPYSLAVTSAVKEGSYVKQREIAFDVDASLVSLPAKVADLLRTGSSVFVAVRGPSGKEVFRKKGPLGAKRWAVPLDDRDGHYEVRFGIETPAGVTLPVAPGWSTTFHMDSGDSSPFTLSVSSPDVLGAPTNAKTLALTALLGTSRLTGPSWTAAQQKTKLQASVTSSGGAAVGSQAKAASESGFLFDTSPFPDGTYEVAVEAIVSPETNLDAPAPWKQSLVIDRTPPGVTVKALPRTNAGTGIRYAAFTVEATDPSAKCASLTVREFPPGQQLETVVPLVAEGAVFRAGEFALKTFDSGFEASAACADAVGNVGEGKVASGTPPMAFLSAVSSLAPTGKATELTGGALRERGEYGTLSFVDGTGADRTLPLSLALEGEGRVVLAENVAARYAPELRVYYVLAVNDVFGSPALKMPTKLEDLRDPANGQLRSVVLGSTPWKPRLDFLVPSTVFDGIPQRLFVVVTRKPTKATLPPDSTLKPDVEILLGVKDIPFLADNTAPTLEWVRNPVASAPAQGSLLQGRLRIKAQSGAPLSNTYVLRGSVDNQTWVDLGVSEPSVAGDILTFRYQYPYVGEKDFRLRMEVRDVLGNRVVTGHSPPAFGTRPEGHRVDCWNNSRVLGGGLGRLLCKPPRQFNPSQPETSARWRLPIWVQNRGERVVEFQPVQDPFIGYRWLDQSGRSLTPNYTSPYPRLSDALESILADVARRKETHLAFLEVPSGVRSQSNVSLELDVEPNRAPPMDSTQTDPVQRSATNACVSPGRDAFVAWLLTSELIESPFPCDETSF